MTVRSTFQILLSAAIFCTSCASPVCAQQALWGMSYGSQFTVASTIERETEIKIGDGEVRKSSTIEEIEIQYRLRAIRTTGISLLAEVVNCRRIGDSENSQSGQLAEQQLGLVKGFQAAIVVNIDGVVTDIQNAAPALQRLTDGSTESKKLLLACCPDDVVRSWVGRPFWMSLTPEKWEAEVAWDHTDQLSLGFLGQLKTFVTCEIAEIKDETATIELSGTSRHTPPVLQPTTKESVLAFEKITAAVEDFSGTATMIKEQAAKGEQPSMLPPNRPLFDKLDLQWKITGEATVVVGDVKKPMTFTQIRKESSRLLPGFSLGRPRMFTVPTPAVQGR